MPRMCCIWPFLFGVQPAYTGLFAMFIYMLWRGSRVLNNLNARELNLDSLDILWDEG